MMESDKEKEVRNRNPRATANVLSALTFSWVIPLFFQGLKKDFEIEDVTETLDEHKSSKLGDKLENYWEQEIKRAKLRGKEPSLLRSITRMVGPTISVLALCETFSQLVLGIAQPLLLGGLISYFTPGSNLTKNEAYMYAVGVVTCSLLTVIIDHPYILGTMHIGMKLRVACCSLIYRKALRLNKSALGKTSAGQIVNLMSNDVNRFDLAFQFLFYLYLAPLQSVIVVYLMWRMIGYAAFIGIAALCAFVPIQAWLGKKASGFRLTTALRTDKRINLMNEIISGIQVIKMYSWEKAFCSMVSETRRKEMIALKKTSYVRAVMMSYIIFHSRTAIFVTVLAYVFLGNTISAEKVFVISSFYNVLRQSVSIFLPLAITLLAENLISVKRVREFLLLEENVQSTESDNLKNGDSNCTNGLSKNGFTRDEKNIDLGIHIRNLTANWPLSETTENTLKNLSFDVEPGKLTTIIGTVGSGKTSILQAILKELSIKTGSLQIKGVISYASQEPWLFHGSVRQNILFGDDYDKDRYMNVVRTCALRTDFEQLPYGDKTIVGERGTSLSGGQKARINLARAVYKNADIYLLDDPLSAVDSHVGKHLFEHCIRGYLQDKTVILITHQLQYLEFVEQIILLENGRISAKGTYNELVQTGLDFTSLFPTKTEDENPEGFKRMASVQSLNSDNEEKLVNEAPTGVVEEQSKGSVSHTVYGSYAKMAGGLSMALFVLFMFLITQGLASGSDYWLTYWVNLEEYVYLSNSTTPVSYPLIVSREICIYVFCGLTIATILVTFARSFLFFYTCMRASMNLHNAMFESISRATMWFFNNNPSGRILNRFSKDIGAIDELLPSSLMDVLQIGITLLGIVTVVAVINPWLLIPTGVCAVTFYFMRILYIPTSRAVKRLDGITRSPVFSHLNASLQGLSTIRAFRAQDLLIQEFDIHQDLHSSVWYLYISSSRCFGYYLDLFCVVYVAFVTLSFLVLDGDNYGGDVGLAISQAIGVTGMFQWGMRQTVELENQMTSVERVLEYSKLKPEPPLESEPDKKPKESWPEKGKVEFKNLYLRYSSNEPWVLKNLDFVINPQEKIGIVGRTGAGKSSLISALFRLTETQGEIKIDDIDTGIIGLRDLRSKISIIPQEPVLFSGTLRKNLDPFDEHKDDALWSALDEVELREAVKELSNGLHGEISEGGSNLSVGQRQLVCLARAILKRNKVLVLDEATANVDQKTDSLIQETIRKKFSDCTVLTIAHRLNTVMDSDRVLVMDAGQAVEFDQPYILLQNHNGIFFGMVEKTGKNTAAILHQVSKASYEDKLHQTSYI